MTCFKSILFLNQIQKNEKTLILYAAPQTLYYFAVHFKLSSLFFSTQLVDLFAYDAQVNKNAPLLDFSHFNSELKSVLVYNFHIIFTNQRISLFTIFDNNKNVSKIAFSNFKISSLTELFLNSNWLERETSELNGIFFYFKKDLRNLMLPYGDSSAPMKKLSPSIGLRELFYESNTDTIEQAPVTLQF